MKLWKLKEAKEPKSQLFHLVMMKPIWILSINCISNQSIGQKMDPVQLAGMQHGIEEEKSNNGRVDTSQANDDSIQIHDKF